MNRYFFFVASLLLLLSDACKSPDSPNGNPDAHIQLHDIWALQSMKQKELPQGVKGRPYLEFHVKDYKLLGNGGCNQLFGNIAFEGKKGLRISNLGSTKMACPEMNMESEFMQLLQNVYGYELKETSLFLLGKGGEELLKFKKVD